MTSFKKYSVLLFTVLLMSQISFAQEMVTPNPFSTVNNKKEINTIKTKGTVGKIFVSPILRAIDIATGHEGEETI